MNSPSLTAFIEEVAGHLPPHVRDDVLLEIESHVLDRADEESGGTADEAAIRAVVASLGSPAEVASAFHPAGRRVLVGPEQYRPFLVYSAILYVVHLVLIAVGSLLGASSPLAPVTIVGDDGVASVGGIIAIAIHALLFDLGLMLVIFAASGRLSRRARVPSVAFSVRRSRRASISRALLGVVALAAIVLLPDRLFVLHDAEGPVSLLSPAFDRLLPWLAAFLVGIIAKEWHYARRGESRATVWIDVAAGTLGTALFVVLVVTDPLVEVPNRVGATVGFLVTRLLQMLWLVLAAIFAMSTVQRLFRLRTLRN